MPSIDSIIGIIGLVLAVLQTYIAIKGINRWLLVLAITSALAIPSLIYLKNKTEDSRIASIADSLITKVTRPMTFYEIYNTSNYTPFDDVNSAIDYLIANNKLQSSDTKVTDQKKKEYRTLIYSRT